MPTRREFVYSAIGVVLIGRSGRRMPTDLNQPITVYKSSDCQCCAAWVETLRADGFVPEVHDQASVDPIKDKLGVPEALRSCHTAVVGSYLIEGHVPAADIRKVLREQPPVAGLAVPGMPPGTPGMARSPAQEGGFSVLAFQADGSTSAFTSY